jgi:AraC-like DNA-binding protein
VTPLAALGPTDPLGAALHFLRMTGIFYSRCELTAPWGLTLPVFQDCMMFHVVTEGKLLLEVDGARSWLRKGDLALVPHGEGHRLLGEENAPAPGLFEVPREPLSDKYEVIRLGGGGPATKVICGVVRFDHPAARHLIALLPKVITVGARSSAEAEWIESTIRFIAAEARELRPGGEAVITRLADVLVIQAIRSWIEVDPTARTGWFGALRNKQLGRALTQIHRHPTRRWTLASLAAEAGMSRSAFAALFKQLVGESAVRYTARFKMQTAYVSLKEESASIAEVATRLGYDSEAAFSRAFKRFMGASPGSIRRA